jgi:hypothetical protein
LIKYRAQLRGKEKANDLAANDQLHKEKLNKATSCLSMAALCGGTFPPSMSTQSHDDTIGGISIPAS